MANSSAAQFNHHCGILPHEEEPSLYGYNQYHDYEQGLCWSEPIDHAPWPTPDPTTQAASDLDASRQHVVNRRAVKPMISVSLRPSSSDTPVSPIIPSPLRIRRPRVVSPAMPPAPARSVRVLIASIGNPPPYHTTRHSAGHLLLKTLAMRMGLPSLSKSKVLGSGSVSVGADRSTPQYTLWQSASMMNVSGAGMLKAWKHFNNLYPASSDVVTSLVVLHDELESSIGTIKLRRGDSSPKGHNGIKSIQGSLKSAAILPSLGDRFVKIGIGIGRPISREKDDVSAWVLGQLTHPERAKVEAAADSVLAVLESEIGKWE